MQTRIRRLPGPALAGGLAALGGMALWRLGIEFERAWMRSDEGPLLGDPSPGARGPSAGCGSAPQRGHSAQTIPAIGRSRRWVADRHPRADHSRGMPRAAHVA